MQRLRSAAGRLCLLAVHDAVTAKLIYHTGFGIVVAVCLGEALAQRPVISAAIAEAREKGDLSENAEYDAAREAQSLLEIKIANLKNMVANAKDIDESQVGTDKVQMLNKVKVLNLNAKQTMEFTIVGETEADFSKGKLAVTTPIAKALLGHRKGEVVEAKVPSGIIKFEILDISL